jgi:hypothetical protein
MRYLLKRISGDTKQLSFAYANPFALSHTVFGCGGALCIMHCLVPSHVITHIEVIVTHIEHCLNGLWQRQSESDVNDDGVSNESSDDGAIHPNVHIMHHSG